MCCSSCFIRFFLSLSKSTLIPSRIVKYLGFLVNSELCAVLREDVLSNRTVSIKTLQSLAAKFRVSVSLFLRPCSLLGRSIVLLLVFFNRPV